MLKTLIAMPIKQINPHTAACLHRDTSDLSRGYDYVCTEGCAYVDLARGLLAEQVRQTLERRAHDVVLWIDEDMRWDESDADMLVDFVRHVRRDLERAPLLHATYAQRGTTGATCHQRLIATPQPRDLVVQNQVFPAVVGGLGFCAIHRDGFANFAAQVKTYRVTSCQQNALDMFPTGLINGQWYGEDILHCLRQFDLGDGSYWVRPMVVEHMASTYGPPLGMRLPAPEALAELAGDTQPHQPDHQYEQQSEQHT